MKTKTTIKNTLVLASCFILLLATGCSTGGNGDKFDGLMVVDGDGRVLLLKHHFGETYFIKDISTKQVPNSEINKKLKIMLGN